MAKKCVLSGNIEIKQKVVPLDDFEVKFVCHELIFTPNQVSNIILTDKVNDAVDHRIVFEIHMHVVV